MSQRNSGKQVSKRLYECQDCHERRMVPWVELNRAARPKCYGCGSIHLELVSPEAIKDMHRLQAERLTGTGGSLKLTSSADKVRRIVT